MSLVPKSICPPRNAAGLHAVLVLGGLLLTLVAASPGLAQTGLQFNGSNQYVTFGVASDLGTRTFTIEVWFQKSGAGSTTSTGTGGVTNAIPLLTKGRGEVDNSDNRDTNFFLGIRQSDNVLFADYEEGQGQLQPSLNHPVIGVTPIVNGVWYHAAATFDGSNFRLYLNGVLENEVTGLSGRLPRWDSIQHAGLASAMTSTGAAAGFFQGVLDEARVWDHARTGANIADSLDLEIGTAPGLLGRWGLNEGSGTIANNSVSGGSNGTLTNGPGWVAGAPVNGTPPNAPTGLTAAAILHTQIQLGWTDNSGNESSFEIERSTTGSGGPFGFLASVGANVTTFVDKDLAPSAEYCYRVHARNASGSSANAGPQCATTPASANAALDFSGNTAWVTFGDPDALDLPQFTVETWFRRDGVGVTTNTGTGGVTAIPLVTKGRAETDGSNVDMNYFLGIRGSDGVLAADFEEGAGGTTPGLNHPIAGVTPIATGQWYHAAATYDGNKWQLFLNGALEAELVVGQPVQSSSIQHAALASALSSTGADSGHFDGVLDEARIWNYARTASQIFSTVNSQITTPQTGLVARWGLNEGTGATVNGSAGTTVNGTITGTSYAWVPGAPFNIAPPSPPAAPTNLLAVANSSSQVHLTWTDNANNETAYEVERSTSGSGGPFGPLATIPANSQAYDDNTVSPTTEYCYRVRATNAAGPSGHAGPSCATTPVFTGYALDLGGTNAYVTFGAAPTLGLAQFTLETWFRRDGTGVTANTGTGGVDAIPLVTKGMHESDGSVVDMNYFLGIRASDNVLVADFEEGGGGTTPGLNHPVAGSTPILNGQWYHAAVTYDGSKWQLFLNGNLETELTIGQPVQSTSTQHSGLGSALNSTGVSEGRLDGVLDEVRIWNYARTQAQIQSTANAKLTVPQTGLVARWGLDEGSGTAVNGSAGTTVNGTVQGTNFAWVSGAPFNLSFNLPPNQPTLVTPANDATNVSTSPNLTVGVSDPESDNLTVTYYGRPITGAAGPDFTLIGLPDTQNYTGQLNGGTNAMFKSQTQWIVSNKTARNIAYVVQLGDCTENGQNGGNEIEWLRADSSMSYVEDPISTGLPFGIPYGVCVGNHDQTANGDANGSTQFYNDHFGVSRFAGRPYYGGHFDDINDDWFDLFSISGMDFIVVSMEYDTTPETNVLNWADSLLTVYSSRRAIVASHNLIGTGNPGSFSTQGSAIYNALKGHANLFLMLCGHSPGEGRRQDTFGGNTVHTLLADYQSRTNGGSGWLRILEFSPANNVIRVRTYSPWLGQYEADADSSSQFTIPYNMAGGAAFQMIGQLTNVPSGTNATINWPGLDPNTQYEWYVTVSDGSATVTSPVWRFTTAADVTPPTVAVVAPNGGEQYTIGATANLQWTASDASGVSSIDLLLSRSGDSGTYDPIVSGLANSGSYNWTVTGPTTNTAFLKVVAHDAIGNTGSDISNAAFKILPSTGVDEGPVTEFALAPVSPNPITKSGRISFAVPREARIRLSIVDVQGREIAVLADGAYPAGRYPITWDGRTSGGAAQAGLYFVRLQVPGQSFTRRLVLVR